MVADRLALSQRGRASALTILCVLVICCLAQPIVLAQNTGKAALLQQAQQTFASALENLDRVDKRLKEKEQAHIFFAKFVDKSTPEALVRGLSIEIDILKKLIETNELVGKVVIVVNRVARNEGLNTTLAEAGEKLQSIDDGLKGLQKTLAQHAGARQSFKLRLQQMTDRLSAANPGNTSSLIRLRVELDPESLDRELSQQRQIISSVLTTINVVK